MKKMPQLNIPQEELPVFKKILDLSESQFKSLIAAISETAPTLEREGFVNKVSQKLKNIPTQDIFEILGTVFSLYYIKEKSPFLTEEFVKAVCDSAIEDLSKSAIFSNKNRKNFLERLKALLKFDQSIAVTTKAMEVMTEHEHVFCSTRILTDIRPIFTNNHTSASGAVIIHNLKIGFHDNFTGEHKEFYVALDTNDIQELKEAILRSEQKNKSLVDIMKKSKLPYLEA